MEKTSTNIKLKTFSVKEDTTDIKIKKLEKIRNIFKIILFEFALAAVIIFMTLMLQLFTPAEIFIEVLKWIVLASIFVMVCCLLVITLLSNKLVELLKNKDQEDK